MTPVLGLVLLPLLAQDVPRLKPDSDSPVAKTALLEGFVLNDLTSQALKRGTVILRPKNGGRPASADTDDYGKFSMSGIAPGQYSIEARRDGFIPAQWGRRGNIRMPRVFSLLEGQEIKDLTFRLQAFAIIEGRVKFDDAEAAMNVPVLAYRKTFLRGRLEYLVAGSARTNDRGEYRISGLSPGDYVIAAIYNKPVRPRHDDDDPMDAPESEMSYGSTFYSSGRELRDAVPVSVRAGDELRAIDVFLGPVKTLRVRMEVYDGCTGARSSTAAVELYRVDASSYGMTPVNADIQSRDGVYIVRGLAPGSYLAVASSEPKTKECPGNVRTQRTLDVSTYPIDNFKLTMMPPMLTRIAVTSDDPKGNKDYSGLGFHFEPRLGRGSSINVSVDRNQNRNALLYHDEVYDVVIDRGLSDEYFAGPYQVAANGFLRLQIGTKGAQLFGMVMNEKREAVPGATVTLIPDPAKDRAQIYGETYTNEQGQFLARGLAPGRYIVIPWLDAAPCDFYNWEYQDSCRALGTSFDVKAGEQKALELKLKVEP